MRRAVAEYLAALDEAAEPNLNRKAPKVILPSDPASTWTAKVNKRFSSATASTIENAVIVDV